MVHFRDIVQLTNRGLSKSGMFQKLFFQDHTFLGKNGRPLQRSTVTQRRWAKKMWLKSSGEESTNKTRFILGASLAN